MQAFLQTVRDIALLIARIIAGVTLVAHGWHRWQIAGLDSQLALLEQAGIPYGYGLTIATIAFEIVGGVLLVFGLATPLIALGMVVLNVTVILTTRAESGFYQYTGGWEYNAIQAALGLLLMVFGSGRAGLDHLFVRPQDDGDTLIGEESPATP